MSKQFYSYNALGLRCDVVPFQQILEEMCPTESLASEVEEELSSIVISSIQAIVKGSCLLSKHRKAESLEPEDIALYLKTQCNLDPSLISDDYYYAAGDCEKQAPIPRARGRPPRNKENQSKLHKRCIDEPYLIKISKFKEEISPTTESKNRNSERKQS